jgi:hypothetical protein
VAARPLPETEDADCPFWSWDGSWIGFFAGGKLKTITASGSRATKTSRARDSEVDVSKEGFAE